MKKLLIILIPVFIILIIMAQVDDDLSMESENLIDRLATKGTSESYLFLFGIFANEEDDPVNVGRELLEEYRKLDVDALYDVTEYPESKKLLLPTGDGFCRTWEDDCLEYLFSHPFDVASLLEEYSVLIARSEMFYEFDEYKTLSKPTAHELFPPYQYIAAAERIKVIEAISAYRNGDAKGAIKLLLLQFSKLRKSMEFQDSLIGKLVFLAKLSEIIDVMSIMLSNYDAEIELIPSLSESEKSFYMIAAREFGMSYYTFMSLDKHPEFFKMGGDFPGWVTRIVYKPNMTINSVAPIFYKLEQLAQLSSPDFAKRVEASKSEPPSTSKLRNYVGSVLIAIAPEYTEYVARFYDFDAKLALFNQIHHSKLSLKNLKNPYYGKEAPKEVNGSLCFRGPLEDKRALRCLRVKI